jgi:3-dehydroquinate dehydratase-2
LHLFSRFDFTHDLAPVCASSIVGFGPFGYHLAMIGMTQIMSEVKAAKEMQAQQATAAQQA